MLVFHFFAVWSFVVVVLDRFFFIWETKKVVAGRVRQVVVLYSNDCIEICLGRLSSGLTVVMNILFCVTIFTRFSLRTRKAAGFKSLRLSYRKIIQVI